MSAATLSLATSARMHSCFADLAGLFDRLTVRACARRGTFAGRSSCVPSQVHYINWFSRSRDLAEASVAQLAEQLICNQQVMGSSPSAGSVECTQVR